MLEGLLGRLDARLVFIVGKGGVGKSTCAGAVALRRADAGEEVHLVSTDPAHSVGDLFGQPLTAGAPTPSACNPRLLLEEVNAGGRARAWLERVRGPVAELVDLGTYLEGEDVLALLDRSLPGMDELMAALRLVEIADAREGNHVVVDTAPTGHTLRMLEAGTVLEGWSAAFAAMAEKAAAVAVGLTRRRPRLAGEAVVAELREQVERFERDVLAGADFVVVHREGEVVAAETERLAAALARRGHRVRAFVDVGGCGGLRASAPVFAVPWLPDATGCEGLRSWGSAGVDVVADLAKVAAPGDGGSARASGTTARGRQVVEQMGRRELWLFAGKGGVGKSTCAAAFALALGKMGEDVLLLGTDPAGSLSDVLSVDLGGRETEVAPRVRARELDAEGELAAFRARYRDRIAAVFERLGMGGTLPLDRRVLESFLDLAPSGIDEIFALDAMLDERCRHRTLVVDAAPTGHFLRLLEMPQVARSWVRGLLKILLEYRSVVGLDDIAPQLLQLARRLDDFVTLLQDPGRAGVVLVTLDERLARLESERMARALSAGGTAPAAVVHNLWTEGTPDAVDVPGVPAVLAPRVEPPPVGRERLLDFLDGWRLP